MENFTSHAKDICTPAEVKRKTLGRQIDSFRMCFLGASHSSNDRVGLQNEGNTCYQNAILQILFMSDSFANAILSINLLDLRKISGLCSWLSQCERYFRCSFSVIDLI